MQDKALHCPHCQHENGNPVILGQYNSSNESSYCYKCDTVFNTAFLRQYQHGRRFVNAPSEETDRENYKAGFRAGYLQAAEFVSAIMREFYIKLETEMEKLNERK